MFWADKVAKKIIESGEFKPYWVDDMFTPSGHAHIGSLRGPLVHDLIYKALLFALKSNKASKNAGQYVRFTYVMNDFDPVDGVPPEFEYLSEYLGLPLRKTPAPKGSEGFDSFADFIAADIKKTLKDLGVEPEYLSSWDMYNAGKFDEAIKIALDNAEEIQNIYHEVSGSKKKEQGWLPLQVICENCGRIGTTRVHDWDGKTVAYKCEPDLVKWAKGCNHEGRISPFGGKGKLPWKVDWPAHWMVLGVTIEGAGKDHSVAGSSRDVARELCKRVFKMKEPFNLPYEFLTIGGKKMSSSKGLGLKARDFSKILSSEMARFLFCRSDYRQEVDFNPFETMAIPDLYDEYDRCYLAYITGSDEDLARAFELSHIGDLPPKQKTFLPRFRDVVNYIQQPSIDIRQKYESIKDEKLNEIEEKILDERIKYGKIWVTEYAPEEFRLHMLDKLPDLAKDLTSDQKKYLEEVISLLETGSDAEKLQVDLYTKAKNSGLEIKEAFASIYISLIGKTHGPRAASFLLSYPKEKVINRLKEAAE